MATIASHPGNQAPPLEGYDLYGENRPLVEAVAREGGGWADDALHGLGELLGGEPLEWGRLANENPPQLRTHDRFGNRIDEVEFHPAWHRLLGLGVEHALHAAPWREPRAGAHVARAAGFLTLAQVEAGVGCPLSMTFASLATLREEPELYDEWKPLLTSTVYDPGLRPAAEKAGALCGMAMTERQGGSDVRANETVARPAGDGEATPARRQVVLLGADVRRVPRHRAGARRAHLLLRAARPARRRAQRASTSTGSRTSSATAPTPPPRSASTAPGRAAWGRRDAASARSSRWSRTPASTACSAPTGLMRRAVAEATHHAAHRAAFGRLLTEQPLMQNVLADLCLDSEAATVLAMRLARAYDEQDAPFRRLATAVAKYWVCKSTPPLVAEALECLGGNGYVEESVLPRLYRESPLNSVWEGAGNVNALDVLRAIGAPAREPRRAARRDRPRRRRGRRASTPPSPTSAASSPTPPTPSCARAGSSNGSPSASRARSSSATATRPSPTRSARRGSAATAAAPTARCRPGSRSPRSSSGTGRASRFRPLSM